MGRKPTRYRTTHLRAWRKHRNLTQEQAADRIGIDYTTLGKIERGLVPYSQGLLEAAGSAYNCEPWELLNVDPSKEGQVIYLNDLLRQADPTVVAEVIGFARGRIGRPN